MYSKKELYKQVGQMYNRRTIRIKNKKSNSKKGLVLVS
jgi:hypothetical protein